MTTRPEPPDKQELDKRRRDLYAISLAILAFNTANGVIAPNAQLFFGTMTVGRPWVLLLGAAGMWAYFLWQFWLAAQGRWRHFALDVDRQARFSRPYRQFAEKRLVIVHRVLSDRLERVRAERPTGNPHLSNVADQEALRLERRMGEVDNARADNGGFALLDGAWFSKRNDRVVRGVLESGYLTGWHPRGILG
jgi:hypothetical protein